MGRKFASAAHILKKKNEWEETLNRSIFVEETEKAIFPLK